MSELSVEQRIANLRARRQEPHPQPTHRRNPASTAGRNIDERLARLQARQRGSEDPTEPLTLDGGDVGTGTWTSGILENDEGDRRADVPIVVEPISQTSSRPGDPIRPEWFRRPSWSGSRLAAAGASAVSFASMVVAMGPLFATAEATELATVGPAPESDATDSQTPPAPAVEIVTSPDPAGGSAALEAGPEPGQVAPAADGTAPVDAVQPADAGDATGQAPAAPDPAPAPAPQGTAPLATATSETVAPTTAAPITAAPQDTAAPTTATPTTAAPTTAPPTTAAPTTAPPTTAAPTTAPPTTAAPTTAPPRSDGSG